MKIVQVLSVSAPKNTAPIPTTKSVRRIMIIGYYVLYTHTVAPYVDKKSRLMVLLEAITEMLRMKFRWSLSLYLII